MKTMYKGYLIRRIDNFCYEVPSLSNLGFTKLEYAKEAIDSFLTEEARVTRDYLSSFKQWNEDYRGFTITVVESGAYVPDMSPSLFAGVTDAQAFIDQALA